MRDKYTDPVDIDMLLWNISNKDDMGSFRQLFEYYYQALFLYAKRFIDDKETREDLIQDVFCSIWENRKSISVRISSRSYLIACVRNHCLNYLRRNKAEVHNPLAWENIPIYAGDNDDIYTLEELLDMLAKALSKLPEEYRQAFELNRFEEKSYGEIAETMHVSVRTVERYKNKAIEILKKELKDYLPLFIGWWF